MRLLFVALIVFIISLIFYLSWLPQPQMKLISIIPAWLADWADENENDTIRTGVPFVFLGLLVGLRMITVKYIWRQWFASLLVMATIVLLAEVGQLFIPKRSFDWLDVAWGIGGGSCGLLIATLLTLKDLFAKKRFRTGASV